MTRENTLKKAEAQFEFGGTSVTLETGVIARQATGAVMARMDDNAVLCTVVGADKAKARQSFFPLTVNYQERTYAAGRIPGGFFRREGRPSEREVLTCRLIDRPIRPLFPKGFLNEVQIVATVMSTDRQREPDILAMLGCSAALALSGLPFAGPIGAARVGFKNDLYLLNPTFPELEESALNMVVAGTESAVLMVESEAKELTEDQMLGAVLFAHQEMQKAITAIKELTETAGKEPWNYAPPEANLSLRQEIETAVQSELGDAYRIHNKAERQERIAEIRSSAVDGLAEKEDAEWNAEDVLDEFGRLEKSIVRQRAVDGEPRIDGRGHGDVRPIAVDVGVLPRAHGSSLFQRGETQAIVAATLGTNRDAALVDALEGTFKDRFMLHYNFPPYSVGETGMMVGPKRREIGHGWLAKRAINAVLPSEEDFPYTLRVVSEITESNGSSSMASVCGTSLALMDAGVPTTAPVAGVAMGLVKNEDQFAVLTDILGDEDHLGDMDFKVAGTRRGVTALQMDIKIDGITEEILEEALGQAREARIHILDEMGNVISSPRPTLSENAPSIQTMSIPPDKVREVIGKAGTTIRSIQEESGAQIELEDDGTVRIYATDHESGQLAVDRIKAITATPEVGQIYSGKVVRIVDFGAFINILPGKDGLLHISQISHERVENISDYLEEGDNVDVVVLGVDPRGRIKLSMKEMPATS